MTKQLSKETIKILKFNWGLRVQLWAEGNKLYVEGNKLWAEGDKLYAESDKLRAEGNKLWAETIREFCGNIKLEWKNWNSEKQDYECHLESGEIFK